MWGYSHERSVPKSNREKLNEITASIERGIKELFQSDRYAAYLRTMSRFHSYSVRNVILIHMQRPDTTAVAGFNAWKNKFQRHVKKGEKGITILAPTPFKKKIEEKKLDPVTMAPMLDQSGNVIMEEKEIEIPMFRPVKVFDGVVSFYYCDRVGFVRVPDFIKPENYLKNAEMAMEDDFGMIDGIINNGPAPSQAVACADYDLWNKQMCRYVMRGIKGIALIDTSAGKGKVRYVFDVSDTGEQENARRPWLWQYRPEHQQAVTAALEERYEISGENEFAEQLEKIAAQLAAEYWKDHEYELTHIVDGSFLEAYDDFNIGAQFRNPPPSASPTLSCPAAVWSRRITSSMRIF